MRHGKVARSVLLTTRDAMLGLLAFTIIAIGVLAKSSSESPVGFSDFLALSSTSSVFVVASQGSASPLKPSIEQIQNAASMIKTAVPVTANRTDVMFQRTSKTSAVILLAFIFTAVVAFMLTFLRHLQKVYVVPSTRRESWA